MNWVLLKTVGLLVLSNCFMTYAWYGHLKSLKAAPLLIAVLASWGGIELGQLKIIQEVVTLCVFVPFALIFMGEKWRWDYLWAFICLVGAVYFVFRGR